MLPLLLLLLLLLLLQLVLLLLLLRTTMAAHCCCNIMFEIQPLLLVVGNSMSNLCVLCVPIGLNMQEKKQRELLDTLPDQFFAVQKHYRLPFGDFPPLPRFKAIAEVRSSSRPPACLHTHD
jgi:hypothetical protein